LAETPFVRVPVFTTPEQFNEVIVPRTVLGIAQQFQQGVQTPFSRLRKQFKEVSYTTIPSIGDATASEPAILVIINALSVAFNSKSDPVTGAIVPIPTCAKESALKNCVTKIIIYFFIYFELILLLD
jgi:hypothetical protein